MQFGFQIEEVYYKSNLKTYHDAYIKMGLVGVQVISNNIKTSKHNLIGRKYCSGKSFQKIFLQMETKR